MSDKPRVFVVDDHDLFRAGVRAEIADHVTFVGEASNVDDAVKGIRDTEPDIVLLDVHMPSGGGRAVIDRLRTMRDVRFLALSVSDDPSDVVAVIRAGARGYVTKTVSSGELVDAIRRVVAGDAVFSPNLAGFVLDAFAQIPVEQVSEELDQLTAREREVLQYIARGYTYREIGETLFIAIKTVETHVSSVLRKLQLSNRAELTRWAVDRKLL